jgi:hypothetical protein
MKLLFVGICLAFLFPTLSALTLPQQAGTKGNIEGVVVRAGTEDPIPGARVTLSKNTVISNQTGALGSTSGAPTVVADSQGRFAFRDLDSGTYYVSAGANGYAKQIYGQRTSAGQGTPINLSLGQTIRDVAIALSQAGSISGRIRDNSGQPAVGIQVQLLKAVYNANAQKLFQSAGIARSDDHGDFRLFLVTPGRYIILAGSSINGIVGSTIGSPNEIAGDNVPMTFYPGVTDIAQAAAINLKAGADIAGVDVVVVRQPSYRIRGRVIDGRNGQNPASVTITVVTPSPTGSNFNTTSSQSYNGLDGVFELRDVSPGPHLIRAQLSLSSNTVTPATSGAISSLGQQVASAQVALSVSSDLDGVVLMLASPISLTGKLSMEGATVTATPGPTGTSGLPGTGSLNSIRVQLRPSLDGVLMSNVGGPSPVSQPSTPDGAFRVDTVLPGEYRVSVAPLPPDVYVKQVRFSQADVLNKPMQIASSDSGTFDVTLSNRGGQIDGTISDEKQHSVPGIPVVLIPDRQRDRIDLFKTTSSDDKGLFTIRGIAPGDYHVFAWEAMDPYAYFDPELLKQYEQKGKSVHVAEASKEVIDVRMIPSEQ